MNVMINACFYFLDCANVSYAIRCAVSFAYCKPKGTSLQARPPNMPLNGWIPSENEFAWGLPGKTPPFEEGFDPLGFTNLVSLGDFKRYREAEVTHGRVAMLAALGFIVSERFHPLFGLPETEVLAIDALTMVRKEVPFFFEILAITIATAELFRALVGWAPPSFATVAMGDTLQDDYYPGDIGFDPLGLKPTDMEEFEELEAKELNNGRLAMIGISGMVAQELVDHKPILSWWEDNFGLSF